MNRENKQNYYCVIPLYVIFDEKLSSFEKLLFGHITALCNEKGYCWASNTYLAEKHKKSKNHISKCISNLVKNRYIKLEFEYDENNKEIKSRKIYINDPNFDTLNTYN